MFGASLIGQNTFVAMTISSSVRHRSQRAAGDFLAHAERVHVGRVEEVDAAVEREPEERLRRAFVEHPRAPAADRRSVMQPRQSRETVRPVVPSVVYCMSGVEVRERRPRRKR